MQDKIEQIRLMFESELDLNANPPYHSVDIERIRHEDWQIRRYLIDCAGDVNEAYQNLLKTLNWKMSFGVHELKLSNFPTEFYQLFQVEGFGVDRSGLPIFSESFCLQRYYPELQLCFRQLVVAWLERMDRIAGEKGMLYLGDLTNTPFFGIDADLGRFRVEMINKHYPLLAKRIILHNVPFLVKPILRLIVSFMKPSIRDAVIYTKTGQLSQYVDYKMLHRDLGGDRPQRHVPEGTVSFKECFHKFGIEKQFVDYFYKYNKLA